MFQKFKDDVRAVANLGMVLTIGIVFAGLIVLAYIIWTIQAQLVKPTTSASANASIANITKGFDDTIALLLVAIIIFVMALMIGALYLIKGGRK